MRLLRLAALLLVASFMSCPPARTCEPRREVCNGADDDCDGDVDEGFELGAACERGVGACKASGELRCSIDQLSVACAAREALPSDESCNGIDDDCDGMTDESLAGCCVPGATLPCGVDVGACSVGVQTCSSQRAFEDCRDSNGNPQRLPGSVGERCNAIDDDCDGSTDETFTLGLACTRGVGACAASGVTACAADEQTTRCDAIEGTPSNETCDGLDDDCDGETDEALTGCCEPGMTQACGVSLGICVAGMQTCGNTRSFGPCIDANGQQVSLPNAVNEACNSLDDDCDGQTDEAFQTGQACDGAGDDLCAEGLTRCASDGLSTVCIETAPNRIERCNAIDDDCDGQTDEAFPGAGEPCVLTGSSCLVGVRACVAGSVTCAAGPTVQECCGNGIDDDQDGATDEDTFTERCNGVDDDCDGQTDEAASCPAAPSIASSSCSGACVVTSCAPGFFDKNQVFEDGCESTVP
ncbi:MAG: MopE-related protein [Archangium sp.]